MPVCPCGTEFEGNRRGRPRRWCYTCRPGESGASEMVEEVVRAFPSPDPQPREGKAEFTEQGLVWSDSGTPVEGKVGFQFGSTLSLREIEDGFEIVAVVMVPPKAEGEVRGNWRDAFARKREKIVERVQLWLPRTTENCGYQASVLRTRKAQVLEEAEAYNAVAQEFGLEQIEIPAPA